MQTSPNGIPPRREAMHETRTCSRAEADALREKEREAETESGAIPPGVRFYGHYFVPRNRRNAGGGAPSLRYLALMRRDDKSFCLADLANRRGYYCKTARIVAVTIENAARIARKRRPTTRESVYRSFIELPRKRRVDGGS